jgi:transposase-like protein
MAFDNAPHGNTMEATTMEAKTGTRRHLGAQAWREVFRRFDSSGDSAVGFCKREGLNTSSFHRWRRRLTTTAAAANSSQEPREAAQRQSAVASFIEMGSMGTANEPAARLEVRLDLGAGLVLHVVRG